MKKNLIPSDYIVLILSDITELTYMYQFVPDNSRSDKTEMVTYSKVQYKCILDACGSFHGTTQRRTIPMSSTGRDKCNTTQVQSIATSPNLHRKGSLLIDSFQFYGQFCMDLHSGTVKSWKQTSKTNQRPMCISYLCSSPRRNTCLEVL